MTSSPEETRTVATDLPRVLGDAGVEPVRVEAARPSMEDVFMDRSGTTEGDRGI